MKVVFTRPEDGGVTVVIAAPKEQLEKVLGPLTEDQYRSHVLERSIPTGALNVRTLSDSDIPSNREFRDAWVDVTQDSKLNIDMQKAKQIALESMRKEREEKFKELDKQALRALETDSDLYLIQIKKQKLRDSTEALKAFPVSGVDDFVSLEVIKELSILDKE
ncbi:MAG: hypothetical protein C0446_08365 [Chitinophaga sp.]|nr:hypothetical protein [Chitinophaga sp.]